MKPAKGKILIKLDKPSEEAKKKFYVDTPEESIQIGTVTAVGEGVSFVPSKRKVLFKRFAGELYNGHRIIYEDDIMLIL